MFSISSLSSYLADFFLPLSRVIGFMVAAPVFSSVRIPRRIKILIALFLTLSVYIPTQNESAAQLATMKVVVNVFQQVALGILIGFIITVIFNVLVVAGESIAVTMGLGFAFMTDTSNGVQVPVVSQFLTVMGTLVFLSMDGHLALVELLALSFDIAPVSGSFDVNALWLFLDWTSVLFTGALMVALPALISMLCVNIVMGVMTRSAPQLNIFSVGFPVTMLLGFVVILVTLPSIYSKFQALLSGGMTFSYGLLDALTS